MSVSFLDLFFLVILIVCVIIATIKGFIKSCVSKAAFIVSILVAVAFTSNVETIIKKWVDIKYVTTALSFLALFIIAYLVLKLVQLLIEKIFSGRVLSSLDRALGFFWGLVLGLLIIVAILLVLKIQPFADCTELLNKSFFSRIFLPFFSDFEIVKNGLDITFLKLNSKNYNYV